MRQKDKTVLNIEIEDLNIYKPKTKENRLIYEDILSKVSQLIGDVPRDVLKETCDEILAVLKNDKTKPNEKKEEI